jgi:hypothetical protein
MTIIQQQSYEVLPVGEYAAHIRAVEETEGVYGPQLKFHFELEGAHAGREIIGWCSATFSPKSKLYSWARAAFGRDIPPTYDLDTRHLEGRRVRLALVTRAGDDGTEYNRVDSVRPASNGSPAPTPAPEPVRGPVTVNEHDYPDPDDGEGLPF